MLYHDHPVLIKPYQIYVSEQKSQEVGACTRMFYCQLCFFADGFIWAGLWSDQRRRGGYFKWTDSAVSHIGAICRHILTVYLRGIPGSIHVYAGTKKSDVLSKEEGAIHPLTRGFRKYWSVISCRMVLKNLFVHPTPVYHVPACPPQPALSLYTMVSCWTWITRLLNDEHAGWLSCSLAWLIIGCEWGAGVSPYSLWVISGRVSSPCLPSYTHTHTHTQMQQYPYIPPLTSLQPHPATTTTASSSEQDYVRERESCGILKHVFISFSLRRLHTIKQRKIRRAALSLCDF